jgi:hypothetical protein
LALSGDDAINEADQASPPDLPFDVPPFDKHERVLMTVNSDGTEERHFFGVGLTQPRELPDGRIPTRGEGSGLIVLLKIA